MYNIQVQDYDFGWQTQSTSRDLAPLLATYHIMCEDWKAGKFPDVVNVRLVLVLLEDHPS